MKPEASSTKDEAIAESHPASGRLSVGTKVVFGLAAGCCTAIMLLCAGIGLLPIFGKAYLDKAARVDLTPEEIGVEARKLALISLPRTFQPKGLLFVDDGKEATRLLQGAFYEVAEGRGTLAIVKILPSAMTTKQGSQLMPRLRAALKTQGQLKLAFKMVDTRAVNVRVRGQMTEFYVSIGIDSTTNTRLWEVAGTFPGEQGPTLLFMRMPTVLMSEEEVRDLLDSIR